MDVFYFRCFRVLLSLLFQGERRSGMNTSEIMDVLMLVISFPPCIIALIEIYDYFKDIDG